MILQLNPPIPVETPRGKALAQLVIDYGPEHDLLWVCFQDDTKECWTWGNQQIRAQTNVTMNRPSSAPMTASYPLGGTGIMASYGDQIWTTRMGSPGSVTRVPVGT